MSDAPFPSPPLSSAGRFRLPAVWPVAADPQAASRLLDRVAEQGRAQARFASGPGRALLQSLGGNSPYLADLAVRELSCLRLMARLGPDQMVARILAELGAASPGMARPALARILRQAKRQAALVIAVADLGGVWKLDQVVAALSDLAQATLGLAVSHLLLEGHESGELALPDPANPQAGSGFVALGMGKLGAGELNYSSDIDLVLLHDPDSGVYRGDQPSGFFSRLSRNLVTLMEARDADGYVFRTDLRLRPDPAATPPCLRLEAALAYYESMGQNWERAAMLKARPVAGDLAMGHGFLDAIRPFIWRRHLDFAAVADIHAMKQRIDAHRHTALSLAPDPVARLLGHNVKLGQGGIREIEFLAQTLQLVWGGRNPGLREPRTLVALRLLAGAGHLGKRAAVELASAYRFLRAVEHRLQMVADRQTHELPEKREHLERFALFMGYGDAAAFAAVMLRHLERVMHRYGEVFDAVPQVASGQRLDFAGIAPPPATLAALSGMGFAHPDRVAAAVQGWLAGRVRATRAQRARELLDEVLPRLLASLALQSQPDAAFMRFAGFLERLPAGVQLLSLFQRNPSLIQRVADVLGAAPMLSEHLARSPQALEGLINPEESPSYTKLLRARLGDARVLEDAIALIRTTVREQDFILSVATLEGRMDVDDAGVRRSALADAALSALLPRVLADFASRFGRVRGGVVAVVLLGKAGGREMMTGSDLDLMLVYDHAPGASESVGAKPLPTSQWFIRAVHAFVAALTAPDAGGGMYAVDMRLRPSGNKGPVAVSLAAFTQYHAAGGQAWTWERMALTRARVVAGPPKLRAAIEAVIAQATHPGEPERIRADAVAMRERLAAGLPPSGPWDVKLRAGGQMEVEFIAQVLQLIHGRRSATLRLAVDRLRVEGVIPSALADLLIRADRGWRTVQGVLRITDGARPPQALSEASSRALLRATASAGVEALDLAALHATLEESAREVRAAFTQHLGVLPHESRAG